MTTNIEEQIDLYAGSCVIDMGDIFWDHEGASDSDGEHSDPFEAAFRAVRATLKAFAEENQLYAVSRSSAGEESEPIVVTQRESTVDGETPTIAKISETSERRADVVLQLARQYGSRLLREALAIAEDLRLEEDRVQQ